MRFNDRHIFTLSGELVQGHRDHSHEEILRNNPKTIPHQGKFIHGTFDTELTISSEHNKPITRNVHYLTYAVNENLPNSGLDYSFITDKVKPEHYGPTLRTLLNHYSENPKKKFEINLHLGHNENYESHPVAERWKRATGRELPRGGVIDLQSTDEIKKFLDGGQAEVKRRVSREVPVVNTSRLGTEPRMAQGNMTTAERNFWRRKGLGDSYTPIMSFKEFITEQNI